MLSERCENKESCSGIWCRFRDGKPEYLARYYWWAYLWHWGVWFFDHQPVINAILFGQYKTLSHRALRDCMKDRPEGRMLQLTCAYGSMTASLLKAMDDELYLMDVADIQLKATHKKLAKNDKKRLLCARMNAESLAYADHAFATVLIFFLFHELPSDARQRSISEAIRVLRPGGRIVIAEYGACPKKHFLWRFLPSRCVLQKLEPFLESFWNLDLTETLLVQAKKQGKAIKLVDAFYCFSSFYRVLTYELNEQPRDAQGGCKYEPETSN